MSSAKEQIPIGAQDSARVTLRSVRHHPCWRRILIDYTDEWLKAHTFNEKNHILHYTTKRSHSCKE